MALHSESLAGAWRFAFERGMALHIDHCTKAPTDDASPLTWRDIEVPSSWNATLGNETPDVAWYRRTVNASSAKPGERTFLRFDAVATACRVYVNSKLVGTNEGQWLPFALDITDHVTDAPLEIAVRVDRVAPEPEVFHVEHSRVQSGHILKGFHDILSWQICGIWDDVRLERTGPAAIIPNGVEFLADPDTGELRARVALDRPAPGASVSLRCAQHAHRGPAPAAPPGEAAEAELTSTDGVMFEGAVRIERCEPWSMNDPALYEAEVIVTVDGAPSDRSEHRVGFRRCAPSGREIALNGEPVYLSMALDWGHEPVAVAPAPSAETIRGRFAGLKRLGFNGVCVCMWYPPRRFYEIADEMGIAVWQEHPLWKGKMAPERNNEYQAQFERCFRRDQNHPSVLVLSMTCEHDLLEPELVGWWWDEANRRMPDRVLQSNTAFLHWTDLERTHLYDEHTYENSGVWLDYLADLRAAADRLPPRPLGMGESVLYTAWPDMSRIRDARPDAFEAGSQPWWAPACAAGIERVEREIAARDGADAPRCLRLLAHRHALHGRKLQTELARMEAGVSALVQNGFRDVPLCPVGFLDDAERWRFEPDETTAWLGERVLALRTSDGARALSPGENRLRLAVCAPTGDAGEPSLSLRIDGDEIACSVRSEDGAPAGVRWWSVSVDMPRLETPTRVDARASADGCPANAWTLWLVPAAAALPAHAAVFTGEPITAEERERTFEERRYSSGWGLPQQTWTPTPNEPALLLPDAAAFAASPPGGALVITHRLTPAIVDLLVGGGRVLLLPCRGRGNPPLSISVLWGQSPYVSPGVGEAGRPMASMPEEGVVDLLDLDLHRRWVRSVCTTDLGIEQRVTPLIRQHRLHDASRVRCYDDVFAARVGAGLLMVSTLDHAGVAGRWALHEFARWLAEAPAERLARLDAEVVRAWLGGGG